MRMNPYGAQVDTRYSQIQERTQSSAVDKERTAANKRQAVAGSTSHARDVVAAAREIAAEVVALPAVVVITETTAEGTYTYQKTEGGWVVVEGPRLVGVPITADQESTASIFAMLEGAAASGATTITGSGIENLGKIPTWQWVAGGLVLVGLAGGLYYYFAIAKKKKGTPK